MMEAKVNENVSADFDIKPSEKSGNGLFASRDIAAGEEIDIAVEVRRFINDSARPEFVDDLEIPMEESFASYLRQSEDGANCRLDSQKKIIITKPVTKDQEIYRVYGRDLWSIEGYCNSLFSLAVSAADKDESTYLKAKARIEAMQGWLEGFCRDCDELFAIFSFHFTKRFMERGPKFLDFHKRILLPNWNYRNPSKGENKIYEFYKVSLKSFFDISEQHL
jgi:hypothetical protein